MKPTKSNKMSLTLLKSLSSEFSSRSQQPNGREIIHLEISLSTEAERPPKMAAMVTVTFQFLLARKVLDRGRRRGHSTEVAFVLLIQHVPGSILGFPKILTLEVSELPVKGK